MKKTVLLCCLGMWAACGQAQQNSLFSLSEIDPYLFNPATAGFEKSLAMTGLYRNQWNGVGGGLSSQVLSGHLPLYILDGAAGAKLYHDAAGATNRLSLELSYNYVLSTGAGLFSFAGALGWTQITLQGDRLRTPDGDYTTGVDHRDDHLPNGNQSGGTGHFGLGLYWNMGNWEAGLSMMNVGVSKIKLGNDEFRYQLAPAYALHAEYRYPILSDYLLEPNVLIMTESSVTQAQFGINMILPNNMMVGVAFRGYANSSADAFIMKAGLRLNEHFRLFYAFDYLISELSQVSSNNTHEFALTYNLNKPIRTGMPPRIIYNPRF